VILHRALRESEREREIFTHIWSKKDAKRERFSHTPTRNNPIFRNYMGRDSFQQQMEFCLQLKMSLVCAESELQARRGKARDNPLALCAAAHYQPVMING
jgi:hypothetical protein